MARSKDHARTARNDTASQRRQTRSMVGNTLPRARNAKNGENIEKSSRPVALPSPTVPQPSAVSPPLNTVGGESPAARQRSSALSPASSAAATPACRNLTAGGASTAPSSTTGDGRYICDVPCPGVTSAVAASVHKPPVIPLPTLSLASSMPDKKKDVAEDSPEISGRKRTASDESGRHSDSKRQNFECETRQEFENDATLPLAKTAIEQALPGMPAGLADVHARLAKVTENAKAAEEQAAEARRDRDAAQALRAVSEERLEGVRGLLAQANAARSQLFDTLKNQIRLCRRYESEMAEAQRALDAALIAKKTAEAERDAGAVAAEEEHRDLCKKHREELLRIERDAHKRTMAVADAAQSDQIKVLLDAFGFILTLVFRVCMPVSPAHNLINLPGP